MKGKLIIFLIALTCIMSICCISAFATTPDIWDGSVATGFASGTGTESNPYIIETPEQLAYLAKKVNSGNTYDGKFIKLANDIYLNDTTNWENWDTSAPANLWTAIGDGSSSSKCFNGTFDGAGYEVSGIYTIKSDYQGLFGYVYDGTVKNVGVVDSYITGSYNVGGVVGRNEKGTVSNCYNTSDVTDTKDNCYVGGVVGLNFIGGTVSDCYNTGDVSGSYDVGGVVGSNIGTVGNCYNTGDVTGAGINVLGVAIYFGAVGGVVGSNDDTVGNCYNTGSVLGTYDAVGGVVGSNGGTVGNCYNTGDVSDTGDCSSVGGVAGSSYRGTVNDCYNTGDVTGRSDNVGGVVGAIVISNADSGMILYGTVSECYYIKGCATDGNATIQFGIGNDTQGSTTADVVGRTTELSSEQMKVASSFVGFDFDTVWTIASNINGGYPYLKNMQSLSMLVSAWAVEEVSAAVELKVVPDNILEAPNANITREEFCVLIMKMLRTKLDVDNNELLSLKDAKVNYSIFTDTKNEDVFVANALGILNGRGNGIFDSDSSITRQEAAVMLANTAKVMGVSFGTALSFADTDIIANWAEDAVGKISSLSDGVTGKAVMGGIGDNKFGPLGTYTREQAILTALRLFRAI